MSKSASTHPASPVTPKLLTVPQTATITATSARTIWRLIASGELEAVRLGRAVRVKAASVDRLIERGGVK